MRGSLFSKRKITDIVLSKSFLVLLLTLAMHDWVLVRIMMSEIIPLSSPNQYSLTVQHEIHFYQHEILYLCINR